MISMLKLMIVIKVLGLTNLDWAYIIGIGLLEPLIILVVQLILFGGVDDNEEL